MDLSEHEDDPEPFESSEEEWTESEKKTTRTRRRTTRKLTKKPRKSVEINESSDKNSPNPGIIKKAPRVVQSNNFAVGSFVISKKDAQVGDPQKHPWIWRIDGKSLLQKYEPFEHEGKIRHKNTSIYTGWSPLDMDDYAPVTIDLLEQSNGKVVVELHWDELKWIIREDSD
ncbi:hypothetical protein HHI36_018183 [Cryptolaemus montrouzieri]|uniref:Uncharacterized protein n=1 Tax=Cryptolaemus montrouzieri TaxID=559131 RepID=A0ABD2NZF8_9CUCU